MDWTDALHEVIRTPPEFQRRVSTNYAQTILLCTDTALRQLTSTTLALDDGQFDAFDIWNLAFYTRTGRSRPELEMKYFSLLLKPTDEWLIPRRYAVTVQANCRNGQNCQETHWYPPDIDGVVWHGVSASDGRSSWTGQARVTGHSGIIQSMRIRDLWSGCLQRYRFHYTCPDLALQSEQTRARMVGDCTALSLVLAEALDRSGYVSRVRYGYLFGGTSARQHSWVQVIDDDGRWKDLDLSMALLADRFYTPSYKDFCFGSSLNRLLRVPAYGNKHAYHVCRGEQFDLEPVVLARSI